MKKWYYRRSLSSPLQIEQDSTSFFPTLRARCLKEEQDTTKEEIAELKDMMMKILDKLKVSPSTTSAACMPAPPSRQGEPWELGSTACTLHALIYGDHVVPFIIQVLVVTVTPVFTFQELLTTLHIQSTTRYTGHLTHKVGLVNYQAEMWQETIIDRCRTFRSRGPLSTVLYTKALMAESSCNGHCLFPAMFQLKSSPSLLHISRSN